MVKVDSFSSVKMNLGQNVVMNCESSFPRPANVWPGRMSRKTLQPVTLTLPCSNISSVLEALKSLPSWAKFISTSGRLNTELSISCITPVTQKRMVSAMLTVCPMASPLPKSLRA